CRFFGLFEQFFTPFVEGLYQLSYITPNKWSKKLSKILKKATNSHYNYRLLVAALQISCES
ncbi:hypothetical protein, partial [Acetobacter senegalensis]